MLWAKECAAAKKELQKFTADGKIAVRAYHGGNATASDVGGSSSVYNIYWANVNVLRSALYANVPKPLVKREFDDYQDDVARVASIIMQRMLECNSSHTATGQAVEDRLIPGMGQVWIRYDPEIEEIELPPEQGGSYERIVNEQAAVDYVHWQDFLYSPARTWEEVWWVARRVWMNRREVSERFGEEAIDKVSFGAQGRRSTDTSIDPENRTVNKAEIWEVWNRHRKTICWYPGTENEPLEESPDTLQLKDFFPCPQPLMSNTITSKYVAKADYTMARRQYTRVMGLTERIMLLEDAVRVVGAYDEANAALKQMLNQTRTNLMIPVANWAMYAEKGGSKGLVDWFPIDMVAQALEKCTAQLALAQNQLYELLGISDIMRGVTAPRETLGAQQLKSQYSSARLQFSQEEVAKFVQDILRIRGEIMSKHFQPETFVKRSNIMLTPDAELAQQAIQLIKDTWESSYRVEISADTLSIPDYNAERQGRIEFITATGQFLSQAMPLIQMEPGAGVFLLQILQWGIAGFRSGATIEGVFDKAAKALEKKLQTPPQPPQPTPQEIADVKETESSSVKNIASAQKYRAEAAETLSGVKNAK